MQVSVISNYSVTMLLDQPPGSEIFDEIRNRDDLKEYKQELTADEVLQHVESQFINSRVYAHSCQLPES